MLDTMRRRRAKPHLRRRSRSVVLGTPREVARAGRVPRVGCGELHHRTGDRRRWRPACRIRSQICASTTLKDEIKQAIVRSLRLADYRGRDRRRHAAVRRRARARFDRRAGARAGDRAQLRRGHRRRADGMRVLRSVDTIAEFITTRARQERPDGCRARNIFTVDLEEWFHVCGVTALSPRAVGQPAVARRVRPRAGCSTRSIAPASAPRSSSSAGSPSGTRGSLRPCAAPVTRSARTATASPRAYDLGAGGLCRAMFAASVSALERGRRAECDGVPCARVVDQRPVALGARDARRRGVSGSTRAWRRSGSSDRRAFRAIRTCGRQPRDTITEVPPLVADRFGQAMPMGWGWGLRMSSPRRVLRAIEAVNRRGVAGGAHGSSVGARRRPAAGAASCGFALRALLPAERLPRPARDDPRWRRLRPDRAHHADCVDA